MASAQYENYYENIDEAHRRLLNTVVMYDGEPHYIHAITNHRKDGIFRAYLEKCGDPIAFYGCDGEFPPHRYETKDPAMGDYLDKWIEKNPSRPILRKMLNSKKFNRFRPFPFGMMNYEGEVYYVERQPLRKGEQGVIDGALQFRHVSLSPKDERHTRHIVSTRNRNLADCIHARHPSAKEVLENLLDPDVTNTGCAFHRDFALLRGPMDLLLLAYKTDVVGMLPMSDLSAIKLDRKFQHLREVVSELNVFDKIV